MSQFGLNFIYLINFLVQSKSHLFHDVQRDFT